MPTEKRDSVGYLVKEKKLPVVRACRAVGLTRSAYYRPLIDVAKRDAPVVERLNAAVARNGRWGFWKCFQWLRNDGCKMNHKRLHRVYCNMNLNLPRRTKRRLPKRPRVPMTVMPKPNHTWSMDFMHDRLYQGKSFRTLNVMDEGVREVLAIEIDTSLPALRVVRVLEQLRDWRGLPERIRVDNGPELIAESLQSWCAANGVALAHIQPGKPNQNAFIERFNRTYRDEVLNANLFENLDQVREITWQWQQQYNEERPHDALNGLPPSRYRRMVTNEDSTC